MIQLDFNPDDFDRNKTTEQDKNLYVRFIHKDRLDKRATEAAGHKVHTEVEYLEITIKGKTTPQVCRPATYDDKQKYKPHYEAFLTRTAIPETGTPLIQFPAISRDLANQLSFMSIRTVEDLAGISDSAAGKIPGGYTFKRKAKEWLEFSNAKQDELDKQELKDRITELEQLISELKPKPKPRQKRKPVPKEV